MPQGSSKLKSLYLGCCCLGCEAGFDTVITTIHTIALLSDSAVHVT